MPATYTEPKLSILVLDFVKPEDTRACLESLRRHVLFPAKVIYAHNGPADYPYEFYKVGLVDQFIQTRSNDGLGVGTRNLFAACFSPYALYWQNDQIMSRDFHEEEFNLAASYLGEAWQPKGDRRSMSLSFAGAPCGTDTFSERAFLVETAFYKSLEPLTTGGAGPYAHEMWREEAIQRIYKERGYFHFTDWHPIHRGVPCRQLAIDNGRTAERQNPDGSRWRHFPDSKNLWLISGPVKERYVYPKFSDREWEFVLREQTWPDGRIPEDEVKDSFHVWN